MTRGFLAVSAALLVTAIMLSPAMGYTICSSANPSYTIGSGTPYQYTMGSSGLQPYTIGSGTPYQYTMGSSGLQTYSIGSGTPYQYKIDPSALQAYSIGSGTPYQYTMGSSGLQAYSIGSGSPYQYSMGSSVLQPYTIGMGTPAASTGTCEVTAPVTAATKEPEDLAPEGEPEDLAPEGEPEDLAPEGEPEDLAPEGEPEDLAPEEPPAAPEEPVLMNIVETATDAGNLNILVMAVEAAGLADDLSGDGPFTVFAPTDDAFAMAADLDMNDTEALTKILTYHVALGEYMAADLANMPAVGTLEGGDVTITVTEDGLMVNGAKIVQEDVECSNGVIQVIDAVLMPPVEESPVEESPVEEPPVEEPPVDV